MTAETSALSDTCNPPLPKLANTGVYTAYHLVNESMSFFLDQARPFEGPATYVRSCSIADAERRGLTAFSPLFSAWPGPIGES